MNGIIETSWDIWNWFLQNCPNVDVEYSSGHAGGQKMYIIYNNKKTYFKRGDLISSIPLKLGIK